jgi:hypothetical protein
LVKGALWPESAVSLRRVDANAVDVILGAARKSTGSLRDSRKIPQLLRRHGAAHACSHAVRRRERLQ